MSVEQREGRGWDAVAEPIVALARRLEDRPPVRELQTAIASIIAVGALAIGLQPNGIEQVASASETQKCSEIECEIAQPNTLRLPMPDGVAPSPIALKPPRATRKPLQVPTPTTERKTVERIRNEPMRDFLESRIAHLPTLQDLSKEYPTHYADWQAQQAFIDQLDDMTDVSVTEFARFNFDSQFVGSFVDQDSYKKIITPKMLVLHWTVNRYPAGDEGGALFAKGLQHAGLSSNYFIPHNGAKVYRYFKSDKHMSAGALSMNKFGINLELEAGRLHPEALAPQVLYDVTPQALEKMVYTVVRLARQNNLAINEYTVMGHVAGDLLFANKTYNRHDGTSDVLRKFDMPQELVRVIIKKARAIDNVAAL